MTGPRIRSGVTDVESGVTGCRVEPGMTEWMPWVTVVVIPDLIRHPPEES